jgi:hypothetical protein
MLRTVATNGRWKSMLAWLEAFVRESGMAITHLIVGWWEPEEPIPTLNWGD